jgi:hypothetical protein
MKDDIRVELEATRARFHTLLDSISDGALQQPSSNPAWTNEEILFHIALGFFLLPSLIPLVRLFSRLPQPFSKIFAWLLNTSIFVFNWANALGPRVGGRVFTRTALGQLFDRVLARTLRTLDRMPEYELRRGMFFPYKSLSE